jgi:hypothetical protein
MTATIDLTRSGGELGWHAEKKIIDHIKEFISTV